MFAVSIAVLTSGVVSRAAADPSSSISAIAGAVDGSSDTDIAPQADVFGPPVGGTHRNVVVRLSQTGSSSLVLSPGGDTSTAFALRSGDVVWATSEQVSAGSSPELFASNYGAGAMFSEQLFDTPTAPASYSGVSSTAQDDRSYAGDSSTLPFLAPGTAPYIASVSVAGGAVRIEADRGRDQIFESSGQISLGTLPAGAQAITVDPVEGPQATWSVSVTPQPIAATGVHFGSAFSQPGVVNRLQFALNGGARVTAQIKSRPGRVVRTLASALPEGAGNHSLVWDGRDGNGAPVTTGSYTAALQIADPVGHITGATGTIEIDRTRPTAVLARHTLAPSRDIVVRFADRGSGLASGSITVDGGHRQILRRGQRTIAYGPRQWVPGVHRVVVAAVDRAGNSTSRTLRFRVVGRVAVVLGARDFAGRYGRGWGTQRPAEIFNGGDPSGLVRRIHWSSWGGPDAYGTGRNAIFKPGGGYFSQLATIQLHATDLGRCSANSPLTYRRLLVRIPRRPGGRPGQPFRWSGVSTLCRPPYSE